jgi:hypothetical protein
LLQGGPLSNSVANFSSANLSRSSKRALI